MAHTDRSLLEAAIIGYRAKLDQIDAAIAEIRATLKGSAPVAALDGGGGGIPTPFRRKRKMSAAGRKRIAEATRKRWAEWRKAKAAK